MEKEVEHIRGDRTGSITLAGILELISALDTLFVGLLGIFYLLSILIVGLFSDYAIVLMALVYYVVATFTITTIDANTMITIMGIVAIIWGVLGLIATAGIFKVARWGLWLASIFNIVLIIDTLLLLNSAFWYMISTTTFYLLFLLFLLVFPIVAEIVLIVRRAEFV